MMVTQLYRDDIHMGRPPLCDDGPQTADVINHLIESRHLLDVDLLFVRSIRTQILRQSAVAL